MSSPLSAAQSSGPIGSAAESTGTVSAAGQTQGIGSVKYGENQNNTPTGDKSYLPTQGVKPGSTTGN